MVGNREVEVQEKPVVVTPFGTLLHFKKDMDAPQPRVLLVAPLSGHFATLLRETVRTMLPEHDVFITDWHNARDVPLKHGRFGIRRIHRARDPVSRSRSARAPTFVAVCQPCVAALVAVAVMAEDNHRAQPQQHDADGGADRHAGQSDQGQ